MRFSSGAFAALVMLSPTLCLAQSLEAVQEAEKRVVEVWNATPLTFRRALFVSEEPTAFGIYTERENSVFRPGEPLIIYSEPVGYAWSDHSDTGYTIALAMDLAIKTADGTIIAGKEDFGRKEIATRNQAREFMLFATVNISGVPAGDYVAGIRVRDLGSDKHAVISLPFTIAE